MDSSQGEVVERRASKVGMSHTQAAGKERKLFGDCTEQTETRKSSGHSSLELRQSGSRGHWDAS